MNDRNDRAFANAERAWLEPPEDDLWVCSDCDNENNGGEECSECKHERQKWTDEDAAVERAEAELERRTFEDDDGWDVGL